VIVRQLIMMRLTLALAAFGAADAFQATGGLPSARNAVGRANKAAMQVAESLVASPVALAKAADEARGLAIDSISAAHSGHMGLPLGCAEIGAVLFGQEMSYNPADTAWLNRDRFVLSAGHGSMFLYAWLHMSGFDLSMDEVKNFRQKDSKTPGHPEFGWTPGVESTTGPLGQGVGNGVGMAAAAKLAAATLNTPEHTIIDHHVFVLCGDGCLQEGVSNEAVAFAGHEKLDNLILLYDSNGVTLDKMAEHTQSEDVNMRFEAQGWEVLEIDGHDMDAITKAVQYAKQGNGKPTLIVCKTIIGKGIDEIAGTCAAHGEAGVAYQESGREALGLPAGELFHVSSDTYDFFSTRKAELAAKYDAWKATFAAWETANPDKAKALADAVSGETPDVMSLMDEFPAGKVATRNAGATVLQPIAKSMPFYVSGSADLHGSNKNYMKDVGDFSKNNYAGRNFYYGIREHAMGAIMNGMAFYGLFRTSGSTFLVFSDYMRASVRVAALSHIPTIYIWTHDSIGVGEDGPTHQPVETVSSFRLIPNCHVMRPGDAEETAAAYAHSIARKDGPTALILSRQDLPVLDSIPVATKREGTLKGGYIAVKETEELTNIILAVGSELHLAVEAAAKLGGGTRVVSMPCVEQFEAQSAEYIEEVLPAAMKSKTTAIEAGVTSIWYKYADKVVGVDSFGESAPAHFIFENKGITTDNLVSVVSA